MRKFEIVSTYKDIEAQIRMPRRATKGSACYDIFNNTGNDITIPAGAISDAITTYVKIAMEQEEVCKFFVRSGHGFKYSLKLINGTGIIDYDFYKKDAVWNAEKSTWEEGECFVKFHNQGPKELVIKAGEAMAQAMFQKYLITDDDNETVGGDRMGGFGSTSGT